MRWLVTLTWSIGAGSLALFCFFLWAGYLGLVDLRLTENSALAWDATLCLIFFLQHSVLIRRSVRHSLQRFVPDHSYGVAYTITSGLALLALVLLWQESATNLYVLHGAGRWMVKAVGVLVFGGFFWGIASLERFDAFGIDALLGHIRGKSTQPVPLTVKGPYRFMRHPFYAFAILAIWASSALSLDRLLFNVMFTVWIVLGARLEERDLLAEFGEDYAQYRRAVPMFVPRPWTRREESRGKANAASGGRAA
jgi:protein-S-isoprenylcysteine O-methyltransferase Ste14